MPIIVAEYTLIVVDHMFDLQYAVIVRKYAGHDTRPSGRTCRKRRMAIGEPDPAIGESINVGSDRLIGIDDSSLKSVGHKNEEIGAIGHSI